VNAKDWWVLNFAYQPSPIWVSGAVAHKNPPFIAGRLRQGRGKTGALADLSVAEIEPDSPGAKESTHQDPSQALA